MIHLAFLLPLALLPLSEAALSIGLYLRHVSEHSQTPVKTYQAVSQVQCAAQCSRIGGCVQYTRDPATGLCSLWPSPSADNPLDSSPETVHWRLPDDFVLHDDTVAFGVSAASTGGGLSAIIARCEELNSRAVPVMPRTAEELQALYQFGSSTFVGFTDQAVENTFANMVTGRRWRCRPPGGKLERRATPTRPPTTASTSTCTARWSCCRSPCNGLFPVVCEIRM